jgi:alkyl sulfatase BDS1-like metallo-beta-lactamase superfamily hydrolase
MLKDQIYEWVNRVELRNAANIDISFDFIIYQEDAKQEYFIEVRHGSLTLNDGLSERPIGVLEAFEETLQALMDMGINPFESLMKLKMPDKAGSFRLPDIYETVSFESATPEGVPLNFFIYIENNCLNIIETYEEEGDIHVWIREDYLERLTKGDFGIAAALFTGKIKIKNKRKLFSILANLGLKL